MIFKEKELDLDKLLSIPVPEDTDTYKAVPYEDILNIAMDNNLGFPTIYGSTGLAHKIIFPFNMDDSELKGIVTINNSYDKTRAFKINVGAAVKVCSNGMFLNVIDTSYNHKHFQVDTFKPLYELERVIGQLDKFNNIYCNAKKDLENQFISKSDMKLDLLNIILNKKLNLGLKQFNAINNQIESPLFNYRNGETMWDYYNHITLSLRSISPFSTDIIYKQLSKHFNLNYNLN